MNWLSAPLDIVFATYIPKMLPLMIFFLGIYAIFSHGKKLALALPLQLALALVYIFQVHRAQAILFRNVHTPEEVFDTSLMLAGVSLLAYTVWCHAHPFLSKMVRNWKHKSSRGIGTVLLNGSVRVVALVTFCSLTALTMLVTSGLASWRDELKRIDLDFVTAQTAFNVRQAAKTRDEELILQSKLDSLRRVLSTVSCTVKPREKDLECLAEYVSAKGKWADLRSTLSKAGISAEHDKTDKGDFPAIRLSSMAKLKTGADSLTLSGASIIDEAISTLLVRVTRARQSVAKALVAEGKAAPIVPTQLVMNGTQPTDTSAQVAPVRGSINFAKVLHATLELDALRSDPVLAFYLLAELLIAIWAFFAHRPKAIEAERERADEAYA